MLAKTPLAGDNINVPAACAIPFRPYCGGVVMRMRNVSEYMLVLALCLVSFCKCLHCHFVKAPVQSYWQLQAAKKVALAVTYQTSATCQPGLSEYYQDKTIIDCNRVTATIRHTLQTRRLPRVLMSCSKSRIGVMRRNVDSCWDATRNGLRLSSWRCMWMWRRRSVSTPRHNVSNRCWTRHNKYL